MRHEYNLEDSQEASKDSMYLANKVIDNLKTISSWPNIDHRTVMAAINLFIKEQVKTSEFDEDELVTLINRIENRVTNAVEKSKRLFE